jgi:phenylpyruvate tautomerase PptA (4-oxalocrotonate tautomerase family)
MPQSKIYGHASFIASHRAQISDVLHQCCVEALAFPTEKRFHRFIALADEDFIHPGDRTQQYLIIEILMFEGRSVEAKKTLYRLLFERMQAQLGIDPMDVEIALIEIPQHNWGIRGMAGDELTLSYPVKV